MSPPRIRIDRVEITNFKGIDHLEIDFPRPAFDHDPDITVMGSENGLGKTSVFEAIGLAVWVGDTYNWKEEQYTGKATVSQDVAKEISNKAIRSGASSYSVGLSYSLNDGSGLGESSIFSSQVECDGTIKVDGLTRFSLDASGHANRAASRPFRNTVGLFGESPEPFYLHPILYLNSYRKVREGGMSLQSLIERAPRVDWHSTGVNKVGDASASTAKNQMMRALLVSADLFEEVAGEDESEALDLLNQLLGQFAGVKLDKLKSGDRNSIDFRVRPLDGSGSFSFDGLSSGQKEIVSTLFLIWRMTHNNPCIVLIDEPELHLNAQWHKQVVRWLHKIAPWNQYILATHSADVFAAVPESQRILLRRGTGQ